MKKIELITSCYKYLITFVCKTLAMCVNAASLKFRLSSWYSFVVLGLVCFTLQLSLSSTAWAVNVNMPVNNPPVLINPGNQANGLGDSVSLEINASDADDDSLTYSASGLSAGLNIDNVSGRISGFTDATATADVTVTVQDGRGGSDVVSFSWMVNNSVTETADYRVVFDATWSQVTHPNQFPNGAHFSPLVGGNHSVNAVFWESGALSSPGIENMAEMGSTSTLVSEIDAQVAAGFAEQAIVGNGIDSPGSTSLTLTMNRDFPLVSLVTMIAPSPDWFAGVHDLPLLTSQGQWVSEITVDLFAYDAGTDLGVTYESPNEDANPKLPIVRLNSPLEVGIPIGTLTFTRINFVMDPIEIVAHYRGDYRDTSPAPGWQYYWNEQGPIGQANEYTAMLSDGTFYDSDGVSGLPDATDLAYGHLKRRGGHTGRGILQGQSDDRYVIAAFTVNRAGDYRIVESEIIDSGCTGNGGVVELYANNSFIQQSSYGTVTTSFDADIGSLVAGDTVYVAAGPNGLDGCDSFIWDYKLEVSDASGNSPPVLVNPGDQNATEGDNANWMISASDVDEDALQFSATGLPPGLSIASRSGLISGILATLGSYNVSVNVSDGQGGNDSVSFVWSVASADGSQTIAGYRSDYASGTPAPGWLYLWNDFGPIGQSSNYTALQWNGAYYDSDGVLGLPDASDLAYGTLRSAGGHAGRGINQGQTTDRFVIAAYQVDQAGDYRLTRSLVTHSGCPRGNGGEVRLYVNDDLIETQRYGRGSQTTFDAALGTLGLGDLIYVALGPNGTSTCDLSTWDFTIELIN